MRGFLSATKKKISELIKLGRKPRTDEVGCLICGEQVDGGYTYCVACAADSFIDGKSGVEYLKERDIERYKLLVHYTRSENPFKSKIK